MANGETTNERLSLVMKSDTLLDVSILNIDWPSLHSFKFYLICSLLQEDFEKW